MGVISRLNKIEGGSWNTGTYVIHCYFFDAGVNSIKSSIHIFPSAELSTFQVGNGDLQLKFSSDQGKIIYGNSKSSVCNLANINFQYYLMLKFLTLGFFIFSREMCDRIAGFSSR